MDDPQPVPNGGGFGTGRWERRFELASGAGQAGGVSERPGRPVDGDQPGRGDRDACAAGSRAHLADTTPDCPALPSRVVDTVAVGDAHTAGLLAALADSGALDRSRLELLDRVGWLEAARFVAAAAALTCERAGADPPGRSRRPRAAGNVLIARGPTTSASRSTSQGEKLRRHRAPSSSPSACRASAGLRHVEHKVLRRGSEGGPGKY